MDKRIKNIRDNIEETTEQIIELEENSSNMFSYDMSKSAKSSIEKLKQYWHDLQEYRMELERKQDRKASENRELELLQIELREIEIEYQKRCLDNRGKIFLMMILGLLGAIVVVALDVIVASFIDAYIVNGSFSIFRILTNFGILLSPLGFIANSLNSDLNLFVHFEHAPAYEFPPTLIGHAAKFYSFVMGRNIRYAVSGWITMVLLAVILATAIYLLLLSRDMLTARKRKKQIAEQLEGIDVNVYRKDALRRLQRIIDRRANEIKSIQDNLQEIELMIKKISETLNGFQDRLECLKYDETLVEIRNRALSKQQSFEKLIEHTVDMFGEVAKDHEPRVDEPIKRVCFSFTVDNDRVHYKDESPNMEKMYHPSVGIIDKPVLNRNIKDFPFAPYLNNLNAPVERQGVAWALMVFVENQLRIRFADDGSVLTLSREELKDEEKMLCIREPLKAKSEARVYITWQKKNPMYQKRESLI